MAIPPRKDSLSQRQKGRPTPQHHWGEGERQLRDYLDRCYMEEEGAKGGTHVLYGIVVIGRWAKFYIYEGQTGELALMDGKEGAFHVKSDAGIVTRRLEYIKGSSSSERLLDLLHSPSGNY